VKSGGLPLPSDEIGQDRNDLAWVAVWTDAP
jgi:hypothetical protein